jgi:hypothetical protein
MNDRSWAFGAARGNPRGDSATARRSRSIKIVRATAQRMYFARENNLCPYRSRSCTKKFFAESQIFRQNVLHNFDNFVQLPASDIGFRAFQTATTRVNAQFRLRIEMRVTGATAER